MGGQGRSVARKKAPLSSPAPAVPSPEKGQAEETEHATVPARLSPTVHAFITSHSNWNESLDRTLHRLLKIPKGWKPPENGGRS